MENHQSQITPLAGADITADPLRSARVLVAGLGNIGSFLAVLLAPLVAFLRLVDRDVVEPQNVRNQFYGPEHVGHRKVDATADRLERWAPNLQIERCHADLEELPWGAVADVDIVLGALDSLRARQSLSEKVHPLQIPYIDGAVSDPFDIRVQVLLPEGACLECSWGPAEYRQLWTEYPCRPGASAAAPPTGAPACAGAATASVMVAQGAKLLGNDPPRESYEINGDLQVGRLVSSRRRRNDRCHYQHDVAAQVIRLPKPFAEATVADLLTAAGQAFQQQSVQLEFRRGILTSDLFSDERIALPDQLRQAGDCELGKFGLTVKDHVVVRANGKARTAHICFDATGGSMR